MIEKKITDIINNILLGREKKEIENLKPNMHLRNDIGLDSLDLAELTVRIEFEFGVDVFEDGIVNYFDELLEKINNKK